MNKLSIVTFIRNNLLWLAIIIFAGLLTRIPHLLSFVFASTETAITYFPTLAASRYEQCARALLSGTNAGDAFSFASPLYILLLIPVYALKTGNTTVFILQSIMGITSAFSIYFIAFKSGASKFLSCAGALLWLFYAPAALYEMALLPVALLALLISIWAIHEMKQHSGKRTSFLHGFVSGMIAGLRPPYIILGLFSLWKEFRKKHYRCFSAMLLGFSVPLLILSLYRYSQNGSFTPFSSSVGLNLVLGHAEGASGYGPPVVEHGLIEAPGEDICMVGSRVAAENGYTTSFEANVFWLGKAMNWIVNNPSGEFRLVGTKLGAFFGYTPFDSYFDLQRDIDSDTSLKLLVIPRYLLLLFVVAGVVTFFMFDKKRWVIALPLLIAFSTALGFFHSERYWIPAIPVAIAMASAGLYMLFRRLKTDRKKSMIAIAVTILLMVPGSLWPVHEIPEGQYLYNRAVKAYNMGNHIQALVLFEESAEVSIPGTTTFVYARMEALRIAQAYNMQDRIILHTRLLRQEME